MQTNSADEQCGNYTPDSTREGDMDMDCKNEIFSNMVS